MKLLLLDKDGTLILPASGERFVQSPWDQKDIDGVKETIARYASDGWNPVIISNQGGIAAGHKTLEETISEMRFCLELFPQIEEAYFCPDFEGKECWKVWANCDEQHRICYNPESWDVADLGIAYQFRKPMPGMLKLAMRLHGADEVLFVGDRPEDEEAAEAAGVSFVWAEDWNQGNLD